MKTIRWTGPSLEGVPDGYYAVADPNQPEVVTFWRVGLPKGLGEGDVADRVIEPWPAKATYGPWPTAEDLPPRRGDRRAYVLAFQAWLTERRSPWVARVYGALLADPEGTGRAFATCSVRCRSCGRALRDAVSKSVGYGPECRRGYDLEQLGATVVGGFQRDAGTAGQESRENAPRKQ